MGRATRTERAVRNLVELRRARRAIDEPAARKSIDRVADDQREIVGEAIGKTVAARVLGVSRTTLDKWIERGMLPVVIGDSGRGQIPREPLEELAEQVGELRRLGQSKGVLAEALRRLAAEDTAIQAAMRENLGDNLEAVKRGELGKVTLPEGWHPED